MRRVALTALVLTAALSEASAADTGEIRGRIRLLVEGIRLHELGGMTVYLDAVEGKLDFDVPKRRLTIAQKDAVFDPRFLVITAGQTVEMPNFDPFFHNVFSYSRPNDFDLGLYAMGESKSVTFLHPGVVRVYCSIHESMRGVILVAPSPWFARVSGTGVFRISNVPPGTYRLRTFNEPLPSVFRDVTVTAGQSTRVTIEIGPERAGP
jgi:plastocyanin